MLHYRPIKIFTEIKNAHGKHFDRPEPDCLPELQNENMNVGVNDRHINVSGTGDIILPPDRFSIFIKCRSAKDTLQDAKNSVKRRVDYILQTLNNHGLKDDDFRSFQHINYIDSVVHIDCEIEAHFTDFSKCQNVSNLLAEKLGSAISVSLPRCYHAKGSLDKSRKQAGMLAIHNARQKAGEMAKVIHLSVGHAVKVEESGTTETYGDGEKDENLDLNPGIQQRMIDATAYVSSKVNVYFELKSSKTMKKQNF